MFWRKFVAILLSLLAVAFFAFALVGGWSTVPRFWVIRVAALLLALLVGYWAVRVSATVGLRRYFTRGPVATPLDERFAAERSQAQAWPTSSGPIRLAGRIAMPERERTRVREEINLEGRGHLRTVHVEHDLGGSPSDESYELLCLLRVQRGTLLDDLKVWTTGGNEVRVLSHSEVSGLLTRVAIVLLDVALPGPPEDGQRQEEQQQLALQAQRHFAGEVIADELRARLLDVAKTPPGVAADAADLLLLLLDSLEHKHPIVAVVPLPDHANHSGPHRPVTVSFSYRVDPADYLSAKAPSGRFHSLRKTLRKVLMLRATEFSLGLPKALTSSSYHLQIESPDGTFIESRQLEDEPSSESASASASRPRSRSETGVPIAPVLLPPKGAPSAWYADVSGKHYAQKVHLYTRDYYERGSRNPTFSFRLVEDLPGAMGRSFAAAFASAVVIWIVGAIGVAGTAHSAVSTGQPSPGLNPLAFVVAIPSFLASWVAFASPRRSPYVSLATRLTLLFAAVLGLASMVLYLGQMGGFIPVWGPYTPPGAPAPLNILFITDPAWMLLFFLSLVNVVSVGSIMMVRHARHIGLFGGRQDED